VTATLEKASGASVRDFTHLSDYTPAQLDALVDLALQLKREPPHRKPLAGKALALCFMNPSLRTQVSMEVAAAQLGAHPVTLALGGSTWQMEHEEGAVMDGSCPEHLKEAVPVLTRFCDLVALRSFPAGKSWEEDKKEPYLAAFKKYAEKPVVNLESATGHPCQALADIMTIKERMEPKGKRFLLTWAPHIKGLPMAVPASAVEIASAAGMHVTIARPKGFDLDGEVMARVRSNAASVTVTDDAEAAFNDQDVVYAKSWGSIAAYGRPLPSDADFRAKWIVTQKKMRRTNGAFFMHCLPVRRNVVVEDAVLDSKSSIVIDQAENRLHTAKAVLLHLINGRTA
jgi:N-acetylornithine carbamoyltransferase